MKFPTVGVSVVYNDGTTNTYAMARSTKSLDKVLPDIHQVLGVIAEGMYAGVLMFTDSDKVGHAIPTTNGVRSVDIFMTEVEKDVDIAALMGDKA